MFNTVDDWTAVPSIPTVNTKGINAFFASTSVGNSSFKTIVTSLLE